jgi:hypothetical protein
MLESKVGCDVNVWDAREHKLEEECLFHHWRGAKTKQQNSNNKICARMMTRLQNSGADDDKAT